MLTSIVTTKIARLWYWLVNTTHLSKLAKKLGPCCMLWIIWRGTQAAQMVYFYWPCMPINNCARVLCLLLMYAISLVCCIGCRYRLTDCSIIVLYYWNNMTIIIFILRNILCLHPLHRQRTLPSPPRHQLWPLPPWPHWEHPSLGDMPSALPAPSVLLTSQTSTVRQIYENFNLYLCTCVFFLVSCHVN